MIRYTLKCPETHEFESWFQSSDAFEALNNGGKLSCPLCGATEITKAVMAPRVQHGRSDHPQGIQPDTDSDLPAGAQSLIAAPTGPVAEAIAKLREALETHSEHVGASFASEARAIHEGEAPARAIHGEANADEARALLEDGVPVMPLPFLTGRKVN